LTDLQNLTPKNLSSSSCYQVGRALKRLTKCADEFGIFTAANHTLNLSSATTAKERWKSVAYSARFITRNQQSISVRTNRHLNPSARYSRTVESQNNVVTCYQQLVEELKSFLQPLQTAESSVLVDVLHLPERLFPVG
jgi:hypothetical protein